MFCEQTWQEIDKRHKKHDDWKHDSEKCVHGKHQPIIAFGPLTQWNTTPRVSEAIKPQEARRDHPLTNKNVVHQTCSPQISRTKMSLTLTLTAPATPPTKRKLQATLTSSTRACRHKDGIKEYSTHYRVHLSKRRLGGPKCGRCDTVKGVRFDQKCRYAVYDVGTGLIVEEGIGDVDFVGGKEIGYLWEDDDTVWEIEGDYGDIDGDVTRAEIDDLIREIEEVTEAENGNEAKEVKE